MRNEVTFVSVLKAGGIAGIIGAGFNNLWSLVAYALGATIPAGFAIAIVFSSVLPVLVGSVVYFMLVKFIPRGRTVWIALGLGLLVASFYPVADPPPFQDGTLPDETFPLLVGPMHIISGGLALWGIPRWTDKL